MLLNIMFHALMERFQLELFIFITYFSTVVPLTSCVSFPIGLWSLTRHFLLQETTRPVENTSYEWDDGGKIGN